jgi:hypothetical protein
VKLRLDNGEEVTAVSFDGNLLTLHSPQPYAPGAPIKLTLLLEEEARPLEGRTIGSKRIEEGAFEVRLRFVNLRRADRELLTESVGVLVGTPGREKTR